MDATKPAKAPTIETTAWPTWPIMLLMSSALPFLITFAVTGGDAGSWDATVRTIAHWAQPIDDQFFAIAAIVAAVLIALSVATGFGERHQALNSKQQQAIVLGAAICIVIMTVSAAAAVAVAMKTPTRVGHVFVVLLAAWAALIIIEIVFRSADTESRLRSASATLADMVLRAEQRGLDFTDLASRRVRVRDEVIYWCTPIVLVSAVAICFLLRQPYFGTPQGIALLAAMFTPVIAATLFGRTLSETAQSPRFLVIIGTIVVTTIIIVEVLFAYLLWVGLADLGGAIAFFVVSVACVVMYSVPPLARRFPPAAPIVRHNSVVAIRRAHATLERIREQNTAERGTDVGEA